MALLSTSPAFSPFLQDIIPQGTCSSAVDTMAYHREKMNEYLCRKYLAEDIVHEEHSSRLQKRAMPLLDDEGSYKYKDWLARSTTLEDLYRHYEQQGASDAPIGSSVPPPGYNSPATSYDAPQGGGYSSGPPAGYDGDVTGYAMVDHKVAADSSGYGVGTSYGVPEYKASSKGSSDKGMKLQDLFMLALTAIAFLAFGTFIIEVVMCLMDVKDEHEEHEMKITLIRRRQQQLQHQLHQQQLMQQQQQQKPSKYYRMDEEAAEKESQQRSKRYLEVGSYLEGLAAKATATLDSLQLVNVDGGASLGRSLCQATSYSRGLSGTSRIWLPLWGFAMSWIGGRHTGTLPLLTATVQGLAGANCSSPLA